MCAFGLTFKPDHISQYRYCSLIPRRRNGDRSSFGKSETLSHITLCISVYDGIQAYSMLSEGFQKPIPTLWYALVMITNGPMLKNGFNNVFCKEWKPGASNKPFQNEERIQRLPASLSKPKYIPASRLCTAVTANVLTLSVYSLCMATRLGFLTLLQPSPPVCFYPQTMAWWRSSEFALP